MGPCPFRHGYQRDSVYGVLLRWQLQWGHALSGMDTRDTNWTRWRKQMLQWGHALSGMDTSQGFHGRLRCTSFNGAMPFQAWIPMSAAPATAPDAALQWGHALSGMDTENYEPAITFWKSASMGPCPFRHGYG